ncbi:hypothetical protein J31TS4_41910 [Paenibacillus sp. J31TS4]|uniref:hypothetical protein n=1 Tax=Paenibacillus sp. J31TS4 TaxID=2807195 RepID=UPI001B27F6C9|nr:hypothetical protein [Paenibacillus sp. J31TS4]GIP40911.1 hypothetical protein J31TS4_41910 [Paenibacillus sp. J31TS4]
MDNTEFPSLQAERLSEAWQEALPSVLKDGDRATARADEANPNAVRVTIESAGRTGYSFDFCCTYVDSREIKVDLIDVENDNRHIDERSELVQQLTDDYVRHLHECAQSLQPQTHS